MKKFISMAMAGCMALSLAACGGSSASTAESTATSTEATSEAAASGSKTDVAFVTDVGNIDDQSFNQYTWQGVQDFCSANSLNANYYRPTEDSDAARLEQMDNAVNDGAKAVVVAGYLFGSSIAEAQAKYPDVEFLALDVSTSDLGDTTPTENTALITYKEEQAGYLAGYAAVYDGYKELGFLGGMAVPAVIRYGYGFVQGADAAAKELGVDDVNIKYWYSGGFNVAAIIAWVLAFIFPLLTYFGVQGAFWTFINSINYVWSFVVGFVVYILLMKTSLAGNSHITEEEHEALTERV